MPIRTDIQSNFLNLFTKVFENEALENGNKLNVFMLKISNNQFNYSGLNEELENALITYALSRHTYDELVAQKKFGLPPRSMPSLYGNSHTLDWSFLWNLRFWLLAMW